jgi:transposase
MKEVSIIGLDLAKNSFQLHGASADGIVLLRKKLSRSQVLKFLATQGVAQSTLHATKVSFHRS